MIRGFLGAVAAFQPVVRCAIAFVVLVLTGAARDPPSGVSARAGGAEPATQTTTILSDDPSSTVGNVADRPIDCAHVRRKLWVERDGWIIKRVALCR